jgi:hypothetical protein
MEIRNISKDTLLAEKCAIADNFTTRLLGLMGKKNLPSGHGLLITPCNSIHMFFMSFPLDIVFIDKSNTVIYTRESIKPWRVSKIVKRACSVIELPSGSIRQSGTEVGDRLEII